MFLLRYLYNSAPGEGKPTSQQNDSKHKVHSKQSSSTLKLTVDPGDHESLGQWVPQRVQRLGQEARVIALSFTVKVVFWIGESVLYNPESMRKLQTIVVERVEPFGGRSEVIRIFFVPLISVFNGGPDELPQSEGEVDMER